MKNRRIHVISWSGKWRVKKEGRGKASRILVEKEDAVEYAKKLGDEDGYEVVIHKSDGSVEEWIK